MISPITTRNTIQIPEENFTYSDENAVYTIPSMEVDGNIKIKAKKVFTEPGAIIKAKKITVQAADHFTSYGCLICEECEIRASNIHIASIKQLQNISSQ